MQYELNTKITTKKPHPCGGNLWTIVRVGADIKIKCETCGRIVMLSPFDLQKRIKTIVKD